MGCARNTEHGLLIERNDKDGNGKETLAENIEGPGGASGFTFVYAF